ncbi:MAG: hypothetical protein KJZ83_09170 [Burkholderiaceae bacterium]|nr:hypothetical protein [Burkholderiaceae bacterium]
MIESAAARAAAPGRETAALVGETAAAGRETAAMVLAEDHGAVAADGRRIVWILDRIAWAAHQRMLAEHVGQAGQCDRIRLSAALAWPRTVAAFSDRVPRLSVLAAAHANAVMRIKPFQEGNAAMACLLSMLFLRINGVELPAPPLEKYTMFAAMADGRVDSVAMAQWLRMRHLANQRGVESVVAIRVRDNRVHGVASLRGRDAPRP